MIDHTALKIQLMLKGIKQAEIARRASVSRSAISQAVSGKVKPSKKIVRAFQEVGIDLREEKHGKP